MREGNKSLGMLRNVQFGLEIFTLSPVAYVPASNCLPTF